MKPLCVKEADFYDFIYSDNAPHDISWLRAVTPHYYGKRTLLGPKANSLSVPAVQAASAAAAAVVASAVSPQSSTHFMNTPTIDASSNTHLSLPSSSRAAISSSCHSCSASPISARHHEHDCSQQEKSNNPCHHDAPCVSSSRSSTSAPPNDHCVASVYKANHLNDLTPIVNTHPPSTKKDALHTPPETTAVAECEPSAFRATSLSPWAAHMAGRYAATGARTVVVLEDINTSFRLPCVMDIKIGVRHYDDDATPAKQQRHIQKANSTTTASTGVRFIGLQCWKDGSYAFRDKYHGRRLKEVDLVPEARWFFHNGATLRTDCIKLLLVKLLAITKNMEKQNLFKFYSSSLLLVYEGDDTLPPRVDVRMIDFAHTQRSNGDRDTGYLFGIRYLARILHSVLELENSSNGQCAAGIMAQSRASQGTSPSTRSPETEP